MGLENHFGPSQEEWKVSGTKKCQKFQSVFLVIFWSEMNTKLSKTPEKRILDHPCPHGVAQTPSTLSAKKISKSFFWPVLTSNGYRIKNNPLENHFGPSQEEWKVFRTKKRQKFRSGFLGIFGSEMNRKLSKTPKKRIFDHPWPYNVAQTPSTLSAKKISKSFFWPVLTIPVMDAESKIIPFKTILDDLRGVQGVWDQKM